MFLILQIGFISKNKRITRNDQYVGEIKGGCNDRNYNKKTKEFGNGRI